MMTTHISCYTKFMNILQCICFHSSSLFAIGQRSNHINNKRHIFRTIKKWENHWKNETLLWHTVNISSSVLKWTKVLHMKTNIVQLLDFLTRAWFLWRPTLKGINMTECSVIYLEKYCYQYSTFYITQL